MPMDPLAVFSLGQLKAWLKIASDDESQDAVLEVLGDGVSAYVEERTATKWKARSYTIARDGDDRAQLLRLPRPIVAVASLAIDGTVLDPSEYAVYADDGKVALRSRRFTAGLQNVVVQLTAGYGTVPGDILSAALDLAKSHYEEWSNGAISLSSISVGPASTVIKPGLNPRIEQFLDKKRDVRG